MIKYIILLISCSTIFGQQAFSIFDPAMQELPASAPTSYLVSEDCEGTGTPSGWTDTGTVNWDDTYSYVEGAQSLQVNAATLNSDSTVIWSSIAGTTHIFFATKRNSVTTTARLHTRLMSSGNIISQLSVSSSAWSLSHGSASTYVTITTSHTQWRYVWISFTPASSAGANDGVLTLTVSTNAVKTDGVSSTINTGTSELQPNQMRLGYSTTGSIVENFDKIRISASEIGSNPP